MHIICVNRICIGDETFAIRSAHTDHSAEQALFHWHNFIPLTPEMAFRNLGFDEWPHLTMREILTF